MNCSTTRRIVVVTARGHYDFSLSGKYITGEQVITSAVNSDAARLAVFSLASEADQLVRKARNWAASIILFALRYAQPSQPPAAAIRMTDPEQLAPGDAELMRKHNQPTPLRNWQADYAEWAKNYPLSA